MAFAAEDYGYMQRAVQLAWQGRYTTSPNPRVGCVLVRHQHIVGEGVHLKAGEPHAERHALRAAGELAKGATAYVTLEPCSHYGRTPPCAEGLIDAGVSRVVIGMVDPNPRVAGRGIRMLEAAGITCEVGLLEAECRKLNPSFILRMLQGRPRITLKLASSLDGRIALSNGESKWVTSPQARRDVQRHRAESCAILSTAETVITDHAALTVRPEQAEIADYPLAQWRQPVRVILDRQARLTGNEPLFSVDGGPIWVVTAPHVTPTATGVEHLVVDEVDGQLNLPQLMTILADKGINSLWVEAGATLAGSLMEAQLVDELLLYLAPKLMGNSAKGLMELPQFTEMAHVPELKIDAWRQLGPDLKLSARVVFPAS